jgi:acetyl esterase/lipase
MRRAALPLSFFVLLGCSVSRDDSPSEATSAVTLSEVTVEHDVSYGPLAEHVLDICSPTGREGPVPAFIVIHGGGWQRGDKSQGNVAAVCEQIASLGYVAFNINYRLVQNDATSYPNPSAQNTFPTPLVDAQLAVRWVRRNATKYGVDIGHVCSWGESAGAHLAVFLGVLGDIYPGDQACLYPAISPAVNCAIGNSTPTDLTFAIDGPPNSNGYAGELALVNSTDRADLEAASPLYYVSAKTAPTSLTHGTHDDLVLPLNATEFKDALQANGVPIQLIAYDGGHVFEGLTAAERSVMIRKTLDWAITNYAPVR